MKSSILKGWNAEPDTYERISKNYSDFGNKLFDIIRAKLPNIFEKLIFYKATTHPEDVLAVYENGESSFGIQLSPDYEIIVLWNENKQIKIGYWSNNEYDDSIEYIKTHLL